MKILHMATVPFSIKFLMRGQLQYLREMGHDVHVATSPSPREDLLIISQREGVKAHFIPIEREISLIKDIVSLHSALKLIHQLRPDIINVGTPKAGLIGGIAAWIANVPVRVYTLRGLRLETTSGFKRYLLLWMERLACAVSHRVICISPSLRERALQLKITKPHKAIVLRSGSSNGIDSDRFLPSSNLDEQAAHLREALNLPQGVPTVGFVGRIVRDKGIEELVESFMRIHVVDPQTYLLLIGDYEEGDPISVDIRTIIKKHPSIIVTGFISDVAPYYQLMDVLAFPTHREGFGNVALEAAAAGKPVVVSNATGAIDTVIDGVTGLVTPVGDINALTAALLYLLKNKELAQEFGKMGQQRVLNDFQPEVIWRALNELYKGLVEEENDQQRVTKRNNLFNKTVEISILATFIYIATEVWKKNTR